MAQSVVAKDQAINNFPIWDLYEYVPHGILNKIQWRVMYGIQQRHRD